MELKLLFKVSIVILTLLTSININQCYRIIDEKTTSTENSKKDEPIYDVTRNKSKSSFDEVYIDTKHDLSERKFEQSTTNKAVNNEIESEFNEEIATVIKVISDICKVNYKSCHGRNNEMNNFATPSPCASCSCNPTLCPIARNCCPDVVPVPNGMKKEFDEDDVNGDDNHYGKDKRGSDIDNEAVVLPECMQMYDTLPKSPNMHNETDHTKTILKPRNELMDEIDLKISLELKQKRNVFDEVNDKNPDNSLDENSEKYSENPFEDISTTQKTVAPETKEINDPSIANSENIESKEREKYNSIKIAKIDELTEDTELNFPQFLVINKCPKCFNDSEIVKKCEEKNSSELIGYIPVSPPYGSHLVYKNQWCALCNNVTFTETWMLMTNCMQFYEQYKLPADLDTFSKIYQNCTAYTLPPKNIRTTVSRCQKVEPETFTGMVMVDECNKTGNWKSNISGESYDAIVLDLCESKDHLSVYQDTEAVKSDRLYKNIFCFICNTENVSMTTVNDQHYLKQYSENLFGESQVYMPVNIAMDSDFILSETREQYITCPSGYIADLYNKQCIRFQCPVYETEVVSIPTCEDKDATTVGLVLSATLSLIFHDGEPVKVGKTDGEPVKVGKTDGEPVKVGKTDGEPVKIGKTDGEQVKIGKTDGEQVNVGKNEGEPVKVGKTEGEPVKVGKNEGEPVKVGKNEGEPVIVDKTDGEPGRVDDEQVNIGNTDEDILNYGQYLTNVIDDQLGFTQNKCNISFVRMLGNTTNLHSGQVRQLYMEYKITNTKTCSVKTIANIFDQVYSNNITATVYKDLKYVNNDRKYKRSAYQSNGKPNRNITFGKFSDFQTMTNVTFGLEFKTLANTNINITLIKSSVGYEIKLRPWFNCPAVLINSSYYEQLVVNGSLPPQAQSILDSTYTQTTGIVPICYNTYIHQYYAGQLKPHRLLIDSLSNKLNFLSTMISMVSIIIVLVTFFLFPELRFVPGKLFMTLCFNLFIAQGLFTFGIGMGQDNGWCQLIGIMIHFFWLATIFSMNSNITLMFNNLNNPLDANSRESLSTRSNRTVYRYIIYSYSMSIVCVLVNIIISQLIFHDDHYGYGGEVCYINTSVMRVVTFTLPLLIVLLINFGMFALIVCKISRTLYKQYCFVFKTTVQMIFKLSTITGVFWLFGFIYEATGIQVFEYLFILLQAGQGFFLMSSFIMKKRVLQLYKTKCLTYWRRKRDDSTALSVNVNST